MDATGSQPPREQTHEEVQVTVRRSPKYGVFMGIGAVIGIVIAWLVSANVPPSVNEAGQLVDTTPVVGLMLVVGFVAGGVVGAIVAIVIDRALSKSTRTVLAERVETLETVEADAVDESADAEATDAGDVAFEPLESSERPSAPDAPGDRREA